jgi:hypothetical protein
LTISIKCHPMDIGILHIETMTFIFHPGRGY